MAFAEPEPRPKLPSKQGGVRSLRAEYYDALRQLTLELSGVQLGQDHAFQIETRLAVLAREEGFADLATMVDELFATGQNRLAFRVVSALLERDARFFPDPDSLALFTERVVPELARGQAGRQGAEPIRVLDFACASGQSSWTVAMAMRDALEKQELSALDWNVVGLDYPSSALERARAGTYTHFEVQRGLPARRLVADFEPCEPSAAGGGDWRVRDHLRERVEFRDAHLLGDLSEHGTFSCVMFRGDLPRYSSPARLRILRSFSTLVRPGGWVVLGSREKLGQSYGLSAPDPKHPNLLRRS